MLLLILIFRWTRYAMLYSCYSFIEPQPSIFRCASVLCCCENFQNLVPSKFTLHPAFVLLLEKRSSDGLAFRQGKFSGHEFIHIRTQHYRCHGLQPNFTSVVSWNAYVTGKPPFESTTIAKAITDFIAANDAHYSVSPWKNNRIIFGISVRVFFLLKVIIHYSRSHYTTLMPFPTPTVDNVPTCCSTSNPN